jgi:hypothetical protein
VDSYGKHLTFFTILPKIRKNWSLDTRVGGISSTYIEKCLQSCKCLNAQLWDEGHNVPIEELDVTLDKLCESHLVLRRWVRTYQGKSHVLKYYRCHRGGKKKKSIKPKMKVCTSNIIQERRERRSRLCNCSFQIRTMEPLNKGKQIEDSSMGMATILLHTKHSGHKLGTDIDKLFLPGAPNSCVLSYGEFEADGVHIDGCIGIKK